MGKRHSEILRLSVFAAVVALSVSAAFRASAAVDICFLRHGETTWNRAKILQGSIPYTMLTEKGVRMAEEPAKGLVAAGMRFDRIYTSPYLRARHTAELVSAGGAGPAPVEEARIREMCFGRYEGVYYEKGKYPDDNLRRLFEDPESYVPQGDGAETFRSVGERVMDFLEKEVRPLDGKVSRVLCVTHSLVLKSLVRELAGGVYPCTIDSVAVSTSRVASSTDPRRVAASSSVHVTFYEKYPEGYVKPSTEEEKKS
jgi:broad specificity phosphatase PhoE